MPLKIPPKNVWGRWVFFLHTFLKKNQVFPARARVFRAKECIFVLNWHWNERFRWLQYENLVRPWMTSPEKLCSPSLFSTKFLYSGSVVDFFVYMPESPCPGLPYTVIQHNYDYTINGIFFGLFYQYGEVK